MAIRTSGKLGISTKTNTKQFQRNMRKLKSAFTEKDYLDVLGQDVLAWAEENFKNKGRNVGGWKKWSLITERLRPGGQMLSDSGDMKNSITPKVEGDELIVGYSDWKAVIHHFGVKKPGVRIPKRRILPNINEGNKIVDKTMAAFMSLLMVRVNR